MFRRLSAPTQVQRGPKGLVISALNMHQPGVTRRPIRQMTGEAEFAEVFFDDAVPMPPTASAPKGKAGTLPWCCSASSAASPPSASRCTSAMSSTQIIAAANANGNARDPHHPAETAQAHIGLKIMRYNALRMLATPRRHAQRRGLHLQTFLVTLASRSRRAGHGRAGPGRRNRSETTASCRRLPTMHLMSRADTIYAGTDQIQRNIIAERALGLPREPRGK